MAETGGNDEVQKHVNEALERLTTHVREAAGGSVDPEAESFWRKHYGPKFKMAIEVKLRRYEIDKENLEMKARQLGEAARRHAGSGPITRVHAEQASGEVDCKGIGTMEYWCN